MTPPLGDHDVENGAADSGSNGTLLTDDFKNEVSSLLSRPHAQAQGEEQQAVLRQARRYLYVSHLFSQFSEVAWQFCLILFLAAFANYKSLILVSSYGLVSNGSVCIFGAKAGRFVDSAKCRLFVARQFILTENVCVLLASAFCYLLLARVQTDPAVNDDLPNDDWLSHRLNGIPLDTISVCLLLGVHVLGSAAMILDKGFLVAIERDWIVVMSQYAAKIPTPGDKEAMKGDRQNNEIPSETSIPSKQWLSETNVTMKQIDLCSKVAAPAIAGFLISAFDGGSDAQHGKDLRGAAIMVGGINAAALVVEYICTARIYRMLPALAVKKQAVGIVGESIGTHQQSEKGNQVPQSVNANVSRTKWYLPSSMQIYLDQSISMAGVSLSLLYLNVLTFGGIMTAYLVWRGMRMDTVGVWRG